MICRASKELSEYWEAKYRPRQLVGCSVKTLSAHTVALNHWGRWSGRLQLDRIDSHTLAEFAAWLLAKPMRPASVNTHLRPIVAMLRFAADENDIARTPKYRRLKEPKRAPLAFTVQEFGAILAELDLEDYLIGGIRAPLWWRSFLCTDWESGLRVSAMLSTETSDILLDQGGFYCQAENQKDKEADWYTLSPATIDLIAKIYDRRRQRVWQLNETYAWLRQRFRAIIDRADVFAPKGAGMCFHRVRRSTASYIAAKYGVDAAQRKLGHSSPNITRRYLDPRIFRPAKNGDVVPAPIF